ncbi:MAG: hypothetical protein GY805_14200 [Chloroflexi bacterium]|nr:hypothetical protein [Chloroflexota bacterium]
MEIKINADDQVRIGREFPICANVESFDERSGDNLMLSFYVGNGKTEHCAKHVEMRQKDGQCAVFMSQYGFGGDNTQIPEWWQDAEVVWSLANKAINADQNDAE